MRRITAWCLSAALLLGGLSGCGTARQSTAQTQAAVSWSDMQPTDSVDLEYAECFSVDHYDGGYSLITVKDDARYLVVPENASVPDGLDADIVLLQMILAVTLPPETVSAAGDSTLARPEPPESVTSAV